MKVSKGPSGVKANVAKLQGGKGINGNDDTKGGEELRNVGKGRRKHQIMER
jgi:hypothetical protein